jgi:hypothetical protein
LWRCHSEHSKEAADPADRFMGAFAKLPSFLVTHNAGVKLLVSLTTAEIRGSKILPMGLRSEGSSYK